MMFALRSPDIDLLFWQLKCILCFVVVFVSESGATVERMSYGERIILRPEPLPDRTYEKGIGRMDFPVTIDIFLLYIMKYALEEVILNSNSECCEVWITRVNPHTWLFTKETEMCLLRTKRSLWPKRSILWQAEWPLHGTAGMEPREGKGPLQGEARHRPWERAVWTGPLPQRRPVSVFVFVFVLVCVVRFFVQIFCDSGCVQSLLPWGPKLTVCIVPSSDLFVCFVVGHHQAPQVVLATETGSVNQERERGAAAETEIPTDGHLTTGRHMKEALSDSNTVHQAPLVMEVSPKSSEIYWLKFYLLIDLLIDYNKRGIYETLVW